MEEAENIYVESSTNDLWFIILTSFNNLLILSILLPLNIISQVWNVISTLLVVLSNIRREIISALSICSSEVHVNYKNVSNADSQLLNDETAFTIHFLWKRLDDSIYCILFHI